MEDLHNQKTDWKAGIISCAVFFGAGCCCGGIGFTLLFLAIIGMK